MSTVDINTTAIDTVTEGIDKVNITDSNNNDTSEVLQETCTACGREGISDNMNSCNKCKSVKYCNAACKKKHRTKHKKACERRVAELHEEQLFKEVEVEPEECPICMLPMPLNTSGATFHSCCGKLICNGCIYAMLKSEGKDLCPFCRTPPPSSDEENIKRLKKLMDAGNGDAFNMLAGCYAQRLNGLPQDYRKANELWLKAGELGCAKAYSNLACLYSNGTGVEVDKKKAKHYYELAAMNGYVHARHNLGCEEWETGNIQRAYKHFIMAAKAGDTASLGAVKEGFMDGQVTKDVYSTTLRAHHDRQKEMKSDERDKAAASGMYTSG